jgi:hypothetical protein
MIWPHPPSLGSFGAAGKNAKNTKVKTGVAAFGRKQMKTRDGREFVALC